MPVLFCVKPTQIGGFGVLDEPLKQTPSEKQKILFYVKSTQIVGFGVLDEPLKQTLSENKKSSFT